MTISSTQLTQGEIDEFAERIIGRVRLHADTKRWSREAEELAVEYCRVLVTQQNFDQIVIPSDLGSGITNPVNQLFWESVTAYSDLLPERVFWGQRRGWFYDMTKKAEYRRERLRIREQAEEVARTMAAVPEPSAPEQVRQIGVIGNPVISSYIAAKIMAGMQRRAEQRRASEN